MSDYIQSLPQAAKARYLAKLELLGLSTQEDPYAACNADKFEDDMSLWPPLEYGHILLFYSTSRSIYSIRAHAMEKS